MKITEGNSLEKAKDKRPNPYLKGLQRHRDKLTNPAKVQDATPADDNQPTSFVFSEQSKKLVKNNALLPILRYKPEASPARGGKALLDQSSIKNAFDIYTSEYQT